MEFVIWVVEEASFIEMIGVCVCKTLSHRQVIALYDIIFQYISAVVIFMILLDDSWLICSGLLCCLRD